LVEKPENVSWRHKHLVQMKRFREDGKEIFYVDESLTDSNTTFSKCGKERQNLVFKKIKMPGTD
jgi:hypothetical protein